MQILRSMRKGIEIVASTLILGKLEAIADLILLIFALACSIALAWTLNPLIGMGAIFSAIIMLLSCKMAEKKVMQNVELLAKLIVYLELEKKRLYRKFTSALWREWTRDTH